ncbi:MAG: dienelactone hydrolase family protein [Actinomycetota bacterium]|nr:dienelactone hydrolase family protein [Actinomycetota bacterium]
MEPQMIEFPVNGTTAGGYLAASKSGSGTGVLVLQEWWGLVPQIKGVCNRLADEGFTALAPDLYHGDFANHTEMDKAGELMTSLPPDRAARDMAGAIDHLLSLDSCSSSQVGVVGFCMGGMLTLLVSALESSRVAVAAPFYGAPLDDGAPDWNGLTAKVEGHFAAHDDFFPPEAIKGLESQLQELGKDVNFHIYEGTGHAFANEENALGTYDAEAANTAWERTLNLLNEI